MTHLRLLSGSPDEDPCPGLPTRYEFREYVAAGPLTLVLRVYDILLARAVAMKVLRNQESAHEERFQHETRLLAQLDHPGIAAVHDAGRLDDGRLYYTMRWVSGRSLAEVIEEVHREGCTAAGGALLQRAVHHATEVVAYAHARGVVHGSLGPQDVIVGSRGDATVVDWGSAMVRSQVGRSEPILVDAAPAPPLGTARSMAPEQALGRDELVGTRTDVFALGRLLFLATTGRPAFEGNSDAEVLRCVLDGAHGALGSHAVPLSVRNVCERALLVDPNGRYASAVEMLAALRPRPRRLASLVRIGIPTGIGYRDEVLNVGEAVSVRGLAERTGERLLPGPVSDEPIIVPRSAGTRLVCPPGVVVTYQDPNTVRTATTLRPGDVRIVGTGTQGEIRFPHLTVLFQIGTLDFSSSGDPRDRNPP